MHCKADACRSCGAQHFQLLAKETASTLDFTRCNPLVISQIFVSIDRRRLDQLLLIVSFSMATNKHSCMREQLDKPSCFIQVLKTYSNKDKSLLDAHGHPLPPCIVMERGESLDLWAARRHPDRSQAFTVRLCFFPLTPRYKCSNLTVS